MPGHQTLTGVAQRPLGLDRPQDTRATALPGTPGHAATNAIDQQGALDPRGLTVDGNNSASVKKFAASSWDGIAHHLPRVRLLDTALGASLGAGAGALSAAFASPDEEDGRRPYLSRALGGAALGAGAANLVGDRARRYLSNKLPMYGYDPQKARKALMPKSWADFHQAAIADQRQFKPGTPPESMIRRELLRRGMDLPPVSQGQQPFLESTGPRAYTPTATSGGVAGTYDNVQFSPEGWKRYMAATKHPNPGTAAQAFASGGTEEAVGRGPAGEGLTDLLSRHGYRNNPDGTTSAHDLWDFALSPQEKTLGVRSLLGQEGPLNEPFSPETQAAHNVGNWKSTLDIDGKQSRQPKLEVLKALLNRMGLQALTNGGVVFDQQFDPATGQPVFRKQSGAHAPPIDLTQQQVAAFHRKLKAALGQAPEKQAADAWIGVDLDGTLAKYTTWKGEEHIGEPIPLMVNRVKEWLAAGKDVRIMTARVAEDADGKVAELIKDWCEKHLGRRLPVTNLKDQQMEALWDDKAHRVEKNTGVKLAAGHIAA